MEARRFILAVFAIILLCQSCKKDRSLACGDDAEFCELAKVNKLDETISVINKYIEALPPGDNSNLLRLNEYLRCKSCIQESTILCNSCIETFPAQSEIRITFNVNGQIKQMTLDVLMDKKLSALHYHE